MRYRLEIEGTHTLGLDGSPSEDEIVHGYSAKIIAGGGEDDDGTIASA